MLRDPHYTSHLCPQAQDFKDLDAVYETNDKLTYDNVIKLITAAREANDNKDYTHIILSFPAFTTAAADPRFFNFWDYNDVGSFKGRILGAGILVDDKQSIACRFFDESQLEDRFTDSKSRDKVISELASKQ